MGDEPPLAKVLGFPAQAGPLDLALHLGDVVHLRGGNGSGKTSLLRQLAGLDGPLRAASVRLLGDDPRLLPAPQLAGRVRVLWSAPRAGLVGLTVRGEARLRGAPLPTPLAGLAGRDVATLSDGEARQVALAFAEASPAPVLLLDEAGDALDADGRKRLEALVRSARSGGAVLLVDHAGDLARLATRAVDLGPVEDPPPPAIPVGTGGRRLRAAPAVVTPTKATGRGQPRLKLPGIEVGPGLHAVTGGNGAGKSTLLRRLAGLAHGDGVAIDGDAPRPGDNVRLLLPDGGELATGESVADELAGRDDPWGLVPPALLARHPLSLSAGEAQRVALAKALGRPAAVHLLDEPEAHLDADGRRRLAAAIAQRVAEGSCVLAATHDPAWIAAAQTRIEVGA